MARLTNTELSKQVKTVDKKVTHMDTTFTNFRREVRKDIRTLREFMVRYQSGDAARLADNVTAKDLMALILKLVAIIGALVGISQLGGK